MLARFVDVPFFSPPPSVVLVLLLCSCAWSQDMEDVAPSLTDDVDEGAVLGEVTAEQTSVEDITVSPSATATGVATLTMDGSPLGAASSERWFAEVYLPDWRARRSQNNLAGAYARMAACRNAQCYQTAFANAWKARRAEVSLWLERQGHVLDIRSGCMTDVCRMNADIQLANITRMVEEESTGISPAWSKSVPALVVFSVVFLCAVIVAVCALVWKTAGQRKALMCSVLGIALASAVQIALWLIYAQSGGAFSTLSLVGVILSRVSLFLFGAAFSVFCFTWIDAVHSVVYPKSHKIVIVVSAALIATLLIGIFVTGLALSIVKQTSDPSILDPTYWMTSTYLFVVGVVLVVHAGMALSTSRQQNHKNALRNAVLLMFGMIIICLAFTAQFAVSIAYYFLLIELFLGRYVVNVIPMVLASVALTLIAFFTFWLLRTPVVSYVPMKENAEDTVPEQYKL